MIETKPFERSKYFTAVRVGSYWDCPPLISPRMQWSFHHGVSADAVVDHVEICFGALRSIFLKGAYIGDGKK